MITRHRAARLGGSLFVISGLLTIANNFAPGGEDLDRELLFVVGGIALVLGAMTLSVIPWGRLPERTTLVLPVLGLGLVGWANAAGGVSQPSYGVYFVLIGAYIGATQGRWATAAFAPLQALVYVGALAYRPETSNPVLWSVTVVVPVSVLVGETIAMIYAELAEAHERSDRRARLLATTARAARSMNALDSRKVLQGLADTTLELGYEAVALEVFDREDTYRCMEARGLPSTFTQRRHPRDSGITGEVARAREQVVMVSYGDDDRTPEELRRLGFEVVIGTPVFVRDDVVAVLNVGSRRPIHVEASELEALALLADQAGHALQVARSFEQEREDSRRYRRESLLDDLTGLGNRRRAEQLLESAVPGDVVGMLDLDDFKRLNDTQGHAVGDRVLRQLGSLLRTSLRGGDVAARYGGEEFVLVIRGPGPGPERTAERIRLDWLASDPDVTFSVGTATLEVGETVREALARADSALQVAKDHGKNRVRHATGAEVIDLSSHRPGA